MREQEEQNLDIIGWCLRFTGKVALLLKSFSSSALLAYVTLLFCKIGGHFHSAILFLYLPSIDSKLRLVVEIMPKQKRCHKINSDHIFGPK